MGRAFKQSELTLPHLDAVSGPALAQLLIAAAAPWLPVVPAPVPAPPPDPELPELSKDVFEGLTEVKADVTVVQKENEALETKPGVRDADRLEETAIVITRDILAALSKLPVGHAVGDKARALFKRLFEEGIDFIRLPVEQERTVADGKLQVIADEKLDADFAFVGMAAPLDFLKTTHANYCKVIDQAKAVPAVVATVREKLDRLLESMQMYVTLVAATVKRGKPKTKERAEAMLLPLLKYDRRRPKGTPELPPPITDPGISGASCVPPTPTPSTPAAPTDGNK